MWLVASFQDWWTARAAETTTLLGRGIDVWTKGGWAMIALAVISLFIFGIGFKVLFRLLSKRTSGVKEPTWRRWILEPEDRRGTVGAIMNTVERAAEGGTSSIQDGIDEVRSQEIEPFTRDLRLMNIAVGAAPLVGLLGTVTGMLATFDAMSTGGGGDKTMGMIAEGISEALYTTETGLMVALPGVFFHYYLARRFERFRDFLIHLETVWSQEQLNAGVRQSDSHQRALVSEVVRHELSKRLLARVSGSNLTARPAGPPSSN